MPESATWVLEGNLISARETTDASGTYTGAKAIFSDCAGNRISIPIDLHCPHIRSESRHLPTAILYAEKEYPDATQIGLATGLCVDCELIPTCQGGRKAAEIRGRDGIIADLIPLTRAE